MQSARHFLPRTSRPIPRVLAVCTTLTVSSFVLGGSSAAAQTLLPEAPAISSALAVTSVQPAFSSSLATDPLATAALPEAPLPQLATEPRPKPGTVPAQHIADKNAMTIPSNWHAQPLTAREKMHAGAKDLYFWENFAAMFISSGYEQIVNSSPNYGTDKGAFGERLGAAAIRETTQTGFTEIGFAPLLHEDARYYVKGPSANPIKRAVYALTRPLITRKDNGDATVNGALLLGYAASSAITPAYYPQSNRNFHDVAAVYGSSVGGAALGFFVSEFSEDVLRSLHLSHAP